MNSDYRICARCVMDTSDPNIEFDANGCCNHCSRYFDRLKHRPSVEQGLNRLEAIVARMKAEGKGKEATTASWG